MGLSLSTDDVSQMAKSQAPKTDPLEDALSHLPDEHLQAIAENRPEAQPILEKALANLSDDDLHRIAGGKSLVEKVLGGVGTAVGAVGRVYDSLVTSPVRAAHGALLDGGSPLAAAIKQFGTSGSNAPSGEELAAKMGASTQPIEKNLPSAAQDPRGAAEAAVLGNSPAKLLGGALDVGEDPLLLASPASKLVSEGASLVAKAAPKAVELADAARGVPGSLATKIASRVTNIPKKAIETYAARGPEVQNVIEKSGGVLSVPADEMKADVLGGIKTKKQELSGVIKQELQNPQAPVVQNGPVLQALQKVRDSINPHYNPADIQQIDEMMDAVKKNSPDGYLSLNNLFDTRDFLSTRSKGSFVKNGELFISGDKAAKAAGDARKVATDLLHTASPNIRNADGVYSHLHDLDDAMSSSLLGELKSENVFTSAGGGKGNINQRLLQEIDKITGGKAVSDAELLFAAKHFKDPSIKQALLRLALDSRRGAGNAVSAIPTGAVPAAMAPVRQIGADVLPLRSVAEEPKNGDTGTAIQRRMRQSR